MKTKSKTQKTVDGQVRKMIIRGSVVVFSLVILSWTVSAQDFWKQVLTGNTFGNMDMQMADQSSEINEADAVNHQEQTQVAAESSRLTENFVCEPEHVELEIGDWMTDESYFNSHAAISKVDKYNAAEFVEAEMALETDSWMNRNTETNSENFEAERTLQIEVLMNESEYDAAKFVKAEMSLEAESRMSSNTETNNETFEAERTLQTEVLMNESEYNASKFVNAEMMLEAETAKEADVEIEKYAQKQIVLQGNKSKE